MPHSSQRLTDIKGRMEEYLKAHEKVSESLCTPISEVMLIAQINEHYYSDVLFLLKELEASAKHIEDLNVESMANFKAAADRGKEIARLRSQIAILREDTR